MAAIEEYVNDGSTISSEFWEGYSTDELKDADYVHYRAKHDFRFVDLDSVSGEKLWRKRKHSNGNRYLESNWMEFMWLCLHPKPGRFSAILSAIHNFIPPS